MRMRNNDLSRQYSRTPQLLIFDLDGTLIDSRADLAAGVNHMRGHYGLKPLPLKIVSGYIGDGVRKLVERSLRDSNVDVKEALRINMEYYFSHLTVHTFLYDGITTGLRRLVEAGHKLALLTNKQGNPSREILRRFDLAHLFCVVIGGGDIPHLKPNPEGIFLCLERSGMKSSSAWMIGDHYTDLAVAENAGIRSVYVTYGFGEERGRTPDLYFASFSELVGYFV